MLVPRTRIILMRVVAVALLTSFTPLLASALVKKVGDAEVVDKKAYPIIFVHGAAGSELDRDGTNLWPGYVGGIVNDSNASMMALKSDGKTDCCGEVRATKTMRYGAGYDLGFLDAQFAAVYQGFYDYMAKEGFGYEDPIEGRVFYDFVYDWRKDNRQHTKSLEIKVSQVLKETKAEKVILIGHSMGGIQIRLYMNDEKRAKKVAGVIFLATPHHGAPQVLWSYTYGYNFGNKKISDARMWEAMKNWPAGYQLLPDYPAIQDDATGKFWTMDQQLDTNYYSYQEYQHTLDGAQSHGASKYTPQAGLPQPAFARDALAFHKNILGDSVKKYPWVQYYHVAGTGQDTVQYFTAKLEERPGFDKPILVLEKVKSKNGDGTVPAAGAKIEGVDEFVTVVGEHGALPGTPEAQRYVTSYRKTINEEVFREGLIEQVRRAGQPHLSRLESTATRAGAEKAAESDNSPAGNLAKLVMLFITGAPDEKKIKQRDDLRQSLFAAFRNAQVHIVISAGTESEDHLYAIIENFAFTEIGLGEIRPATATVVVKDFETLGGLADGTIDGLDAYQKGDVAVTGSGLIDSIKFKIVSWIAKYGFKR